MWAFRERGRPVRGRRRWSAVACAGAVSILAAASAAHAQAGSAADPAAATPTAGADPNYTVSPVDKAIGTNPVARFFKYYGAEWGQAAAPVDPNAPPATRPGWTPPPQSAPPMPFTDWPYGATTTLGDNHTASVDSPLMTAIAHTGLGEAMGAAGIQAYGWVD